jgi:hypothetical protein
MLSPLTLILLGLKIAERRMPPQPIINGTLETPYMSLVFLLFVAGIFTLVLGLLHLAAAVR